MVGAGRVFELPAPRYLAQESAKPGRLEDSTCPYTRAPSENDSVAKPEKVSDVLSRLLKESPIGHDMDHVEIYAVWRNTVDAETVRHTRVIGVRANTLIVEVDSSPWLYELDNFRKHTLLGTLRRSLKKTRIVDINFRIGQF